jgi:hypothetical protein
MTWALTGSEIAKYVSGSNTNYRPQTRKLRVYLSTPLGKPVGWPTKLACLSIVAAYSGLVLARNLLSRNRHAGGVAVRALHKPVSDTPPIKPGRQVY